MATHASNMERGVANREEDERRGEERMFLPILSH
jgi:hypothetical protein